MDSITKLTGNRSATTHATSPSVALLNSASSFKENQGRPKRYDGGH